MSRSFNASTWLVDRWVEAGHGDRTALRVEGRSVSYAELRDQTRAVASGLRALGTRPEERLFIAMRHSFDTYARGVLDITDADRVFSVAPISHAYGLGASVTFPLGAGAVSIIDPSFPMPPPRVAELASKEKPTLFFAAPGVYAA